MELRSLNADELTVKSGLLRKKSPLVRVAEVYKVKTLLEKTNQKPAANQQVADFFFQVRCVGFSCCFSRLLC